MKDELDKILLDLKWLFDEKKAQIASKPNLRDINILDSIQLQIDGLIQSRNDIVEYYSDQINYLNNFKIRALEIERNLKRL